MKTFRHWHKHIAAIQVGGQTKQFAFRGRSGLPLA
jgi:hypothetical protein